MAETRCIPIGPFRLEIEKIRGSRFIASVSSFCCDDDREPQIAPLRAEFPTANHHCWAWRDGDAFRYGDDGEPSGSAGRPILQQIDGHGFDRTCVVVTRIFGGTKLGVGGLMRAYGQAAREALDLCPSEPLIERETIVIEFPYDREGAVQSVVQAHGLSPSRSEYGESIRLSFEVPRAQVEPFLADLMERCAGKLNVRRG
ncbi:MAG: YigZ family protein [Acidobacteriota bacterium]|nr:YigZ family protein [Acidobacteriota bacterium]MDH3786503.1 YigZ family protein [Acidobacteriota bacterium]